ncbi:MAG: hypothetical protein ACFE95_11235 [Candidatus Hodarchaeota archaeon]
MRKNQRLEIYQTYLHTILSEGGSGNFVIFTDPISERSVQFIAEKWDRLVVIDIPKVALSKDETKRLKDFFGVLFESIEYTYQAEVTPEQGAKCAEKIFRDVYLLPDSYNIEAKLNLE